MKKDAYYFPHFCNARHDRKLKRVQKELGIEGYGIYFMLLEVLREQDGFKYPLNDIDLLADEFGTSEQKTRTVVTNYKLFTVDECNNFFSKKLIEYLEPYLERSKRAREAARKRWLTYKSNANALPEHSASNASKVKKSKVKKNIFKAPTLEEIKNYCIERKNTIDPEYFLDFQLSRNWILSNGKQTRDWKAVIRTWERNEKKRGVEAPVKKNEPDRIKNIILSAVHQYGSYNTPSFEDKKITNIVGRLGWGNICKMKERDLFFNIKNLIGG